MHARAAGCGRRGTQLTTIELSIHRARARAPDLQLARRRAIRVELGPGRGNDADGGEEEEEDRERQHLWRAVVCCCNSRGRPESRHNCQRGLAPLRRATLCWRRHNFVLRERPPARRRLFGKLAARGQSVCVRLGELLFGLRALARSLVCPAANHAQAERTRSNSLQLRQASEKKSNNNRRRYCFTAAAAAFVSGCRLTNNFLLI